MTVPLECFSDENWYKGEFEVLKSRVWFYACLSLEIPAKNDYKSINIFGRSIILWNSGDEIKAFLNICPHRFFSLFNEPKGNSALICKFHNLGFNSSGKVLNNRLLSEGQKDCSLISYPVSQCGSFVFLKLSDELDISLHDYLGTYRLELEKISTMLSRSIYSGDMVHGCNWKLIVENVVDNTHCFSIHLTTLFEIGYCNMSDLEMDFFGLHSRVRTPVLSKKSSVGRQKLLRRVMKDEIDFEERYEHLFIFPNLTISNFENFNITVGSINPLEASRTNYNLTFYQGNLRGDIDYSPNSTELQILNELAASTRNFGLKVFQEDLEVLEVVQRNLASVSNEGFIFNSESRIKWFYENYMNLFNNG